VPVLPRDSLQMGSDRVDRQEQPPGDLGVGRPAGQQRDDLPPTFRWQASGTIHSCLTAESVPTGRRAGGSYAANRISGSGSANGESPVYALLPTGVG
jgi:hypothetical protein